MKGDHTMPTTEHTNKAAKLISAWRGATGGKLEDTTPEQACIVISSPEMASIIGPIRKLYERTLAETGGDTKKAKKAVARLRAIRLGYVNGHIAGQETTHAQGWGDKCRHRPTAIRVCLKLELPEKPGQAPYGSCQRHDGRQFAPVNQYPAKLTVVAGAKHLQHPARVFHNYWAAHHAGHGRQQLAGVQ